VEIEGGCVEQSLRSATDSAGASGLWSYLTFAHVEQHISLKSQDPNASLHSANCAAMFLSFPH
jgi:hypothetical protein